MDAAFGRVVLASEKSRMTAIDSRIDDPDDYAAARARRRDARWKRATRELELVHRVLHIEIELGRGDQVLDVVARDPSR